MRIWIRIRNNEGFLFTVKSKPSLLFHSFVRFEFLSVIVQCTDPNVSTGSVSIRFFQCTDCTVQVYCRYQYCILLSHFDLVKYVS